jgi:hypothetical protein
MVTRNGHVRDVKVLVINPNSSIALTEGLEKMIEDLGYSEVCMGIYTSESMDSKAVPRQHRPSKKQVHGWRYYTSYYTRCRCTSW